MNNKKTFDGENWIVMIRTDQMLPSWFEILEDISTVGDIIKDIQVCIYYLISRNGIFYLTTVVKICFCRIPEKWVDNGVVKSYCVAIDITTNRNW